MRCLNIFPCGKTCQRRLPVPEPASRRYCFFRMFMETGKEKMPFLRDCRFWGQGVVKRKTGVLFSSMEPSKILLYFHPESSVKLMGPRDTEKCAPKSVNNEDVPFYGIRPGGIRFLFPPIREISFCLYKEP
jgi:hypothetical protein